MHGIMGRLFFALVLAISIVRPSLAYNNGVSRKPPLGWNTWCTIGTCGQGGKNPSNNPFHDICTEDEVKSVATAMLDSGLHDLGYDRINLDDCWVAQHRTAEGLLTYDTSRFPNGIKNLITWLHSRGLKFGLYSSMGTRTCNPNGKSWPDLKPGTWPRPGSYGHYKEDAETFAAWEVDYVKMDWCGGKGADAETLHTNFSYWMNATGRPMHLELCRGYAHPIPEYVAKVANSWRVTQDNWDYWPHTVTTIKSFIGISHLAGPGNWNYGDFLMIGGAGCGKWQAGGHCPGQTDAEYRTQFSVYVLVASPLIIGTDIRNMTPIMKAGLLNKELLKINQDHLAAAGDLVGTYKCHEASCGTLIPRTGKIQEGPSGANGDMKEGGTCNVSLSKQASQAACVLHSTFGCFADNRSMWTTGGCRGEFRCDGNNRVSCSVRDKDLTRVHICECGSAPAPGPTPPSPAPAPPAPAPTPSSDEVLLWARNATDGSIAIAVTNLGNVIRTTIVSLTDLGLAASDVVAARDVWLQQDIKGAFLGRLNVTVEPHDTAVWQLRVQPSAPRGFHDDLVV